MADVSLKVGSQKIVVTNPDKILFPHSKITKVEFVNYYQHVAASMLPHVKNRPLTMQRFPSGVGTQMFYQKDAGESVPVWLELQPVEKSDGGTVDYILMFNKQTIVYCATLVCVPHVWLSREPKLNYPDRMIFDLDPSPGASFELVKWTAYEIKKVLDKLTLPNFVMTTGSRGLHVVVPLKKTYLFDDVRACAQRIGQHLVTLYPHKLTMTMRKSDRGAKVFIDTLRNAWSATSVAPYAIRALEHAPVAMPIDWHELDSLSSSQHYTLRTSVARITHKGDVWKDIEKHAVSLRGALKELDNLISEY